jgi:hypothetical protein
VDLRETVWVDMDWIHLPQDRDRWRALVNTVMKPRISWNAGILRSWPTSGFSRRIQLHGVKIFPAQTSTLLFKVDVSRCQKSFICDLSSTALHILCKYSYMFLFSIPAPYTTVDSSVDSPIQVHIPLTTRTQ